MEYFIPQDENSLIDKLTNLNGKYYLLNGGTDLVVKLNEQHLDNSYTLVDISNMKEYDYIIVEDDEVRIGATTKFISIIQNQFIKKNLKGLYTVASEVGSPQIRTIATIVGNVCNASPGGDSPVILTAYNARVKVLGRDGSREIPITEFITGNSKTLIKDTEVVTEVIIPYEKNSNSFFKKYGKSHREKVIIADSSVAIKYTMEDNVFTGGTLVLGACDVVPTRLNNCMNYLVGKTVKDINIREFIQEVETDYKNATSDIARFNRKKNSINASVYDFYEHLTS